MAQNNNILQELIELNSSLAKFPSQNIYSTPEGYFEGLASQVLNRIKTMQTVSASDEISFLSPLLSNISREMPYSVPAGYFDLLQEKLMAAVRESSDHQTAKEELESISPLLSGLKKEMPYSVPQGYFNSLSENAAKKETKVISITHRRWFRYAAAAIVVGIVAITGFILTNNKKESDERIFAQVKKDVMKMDEQQKDNLIDFIDAGMSGKETADVNADSKTKEIKELLRDISDEELKDFQEQTEDLQDVLMTN
ncbi:MAG: hypothetical protein HZB42_15850 [Sphingobacteriales bacterium]|nr:hypothetical protein [Sphingobacteriales bacterium]